MSIKVFSIVIAAALLHSSSHGTIERAPDGIVGLAGMNVVSAWAMFFCFALCAIVAGPHLAGAGGFCIAAQFLQDRAKTFK